MAQSSRTSNTTTAGAAMARSATPVVDDDGAQQIVELRRGPWTVEEDLTLVNFIADHGEGRWNSLAQAAGLKRTGKSCRLRWLNYLRPDVKRGNFTADEQLLILDLHTRYGNRWSKIAQHLPGRTDNEIKNYWRTRVQKHAKQLNCDADSKRFKDAMRYLWMPHLVDADAHHHNHRRLLLHAAAAAAAGNDLHHHQQDGGSGYYAAAPGNDIHHALSSSGGGGGVGLMTSSSSADSLATSDQTSSYYDAHHHLPKKWEAATCDDAAGLYASVRAGEMLVDDGGGDWVPLEAMTNHHHQAAVMWPAAAEAAAEQKPQVVNGAGQFEDQMELSGWVQSFAEGTTESFWTSLDDIWKMQ